MCVFARIPIASACWAFTCCVQHRVTTSHIQKESDATVLLRTLCAPILQYRIQAKLQFIRLQDCTDSKGEKKQKHIKSEWSIYLKMLALTKGAMPCSSHVRIQTQRIWVKMRREKQRECERKTIYCWEIYWLGIRNYGSGGTRKSKTDDEVWVTVFDSNQHYAL